MTNPGRPNMVGLHFTIGLNKFALICRLGDGAGNKIYTGKMNPFFVGQSFSTVAYFIFYEFQVVFFGVATKTKDDQRHLLLNPGKNYELQPDDECFFIAQSERDVRAIEKMVRFALNIFEGW
jgi:hypothetical protein